nr:MAG: putative movement protein [Sichuan virgavirus]
MSLSLNKPKISEFINTTRTEELLPKFLTRLKSVSVSNVDVLEVKGLNVLNDINLLKGVNFGSYKYVGVLGVVVAGEWLVPEKTNGCVTVSIVDKRMTNSAEAILGSYRAQAKGRKFSFSLVPNYFVTSQDATRNPWQLMVKLSGLSIEQGWSPLTIEVVSVTLCANSVVSKGLRERILHVGDTNADFEQIVDDYVDSASVVADLRSFRPRISERVINKSCVNNKVVERNVKGFKNIKDSVKGGMSKENFAKDVSFLSNSTKDVSAYKSDPSSVFHNCVGRANGSDESMY